jgi:acetyltransferase-like isoleucine patch superfamily enzyme
VKHLRRILMQLAVVASSLMALIVRLVELPAGPALRLWRLARLKARVDGTVPVTTQLDGPVVTGGRVRLELGEHCRLGRGVYLETSEGGSLPIGPHVRINAGPFIVSYAEVRIGRDSLVGEYVSIRDADHGFAPDRPIRQQQHTARPIRIGDGAWIARGAVVLKGVSIGEGAIVAANSVVTRDVPPMAIVAGAPAHAIGSRDGTPAEPR